MKIFVYHHDDSDGIVSAAVVKFRYQTTNYQDSEFNFRVCPNSYRYQQDIDLIKETEGYDIVYVVDYAFLPADMKKLQDKFGNNLVWIDHHESSMKNMQEAGLSFEGLQSTKTAACKLCWQYFYGTTAKVPILVEKIAQYDTWDKHEDWETFVVPLNLCVSTLLKDVDGFDIRLLDDTDNTISELVNGIGIYLFAYDKSQMRRVFNRMISSGIKQGDKCFSVLAVNGSTGGSRPLELFEEENNIHYQVHMPFSILPGKRIAGGFYTSTDNGFDCAEMATLLGGGGHKCAAGFNTTLEEFRKYFNFI